MESLFAWNGLPRSLIFQKSKCGSSQGEALVKVAAWAQFHLIPLESGRCLGRSTAAPVVPRGRNDCWLRLLHFLPGRPSLLSGAKEQWERRGQGLGYSRSRKHLRPSPCSPKGLVLHRRAARCCGASTRPRSPSVTDLRLPGGPPPLRFTSL